MLEDFRLKVFVTVASARSFTKAAAQLAISQPAVSQHISELEKTTGQKLFQRLRGETVVTDAGKLFYDYATAILAKYDEMEQMFLRFPDRTVKVAASDKSIIILSLIFLTHSSRSTRKSSSNTPSCRKKQT